MTKRILVILGAALMLSACGGDDDDGSGGGGGKSGGACRQLCEKLASCFADPTSGETLLCSDEGVAECNKDPEARQWAAALASLSCEELAEIFVPSELGE